MTQTRTKEWTPQPGDAVMFKTDLYRVLTIDSKNDRCIIRRFNNKAKGLRDALTVEVRISKLRKPVEKQK